MCLLLQRQNVKMNFMFCTKSRTSLVSYLVELLALESSLRGEVHQVLMPLHPSLLSVNYLQTTNSDIPVNLLVRDHSVC